MKSNIKYITVSFLALSLGLTIGYFIFSNNTTHSANTDKRISNESNKINAQAEEWICSMHPQIRQSEQGLCPICEMDLIPAGSNNQSNDPLVLQMTESAIQLANIQTTLVGNSDTPLSKSLKLSGKIQADERLSSSQVVHIPGRIEKLFVSFTGEEVKKGQKIATLYSPELITAQRELLEAKKIEDLNPKLIEASRQKLRYWKISDQLISQIEERNKIQETFDIYADESGVVTQKMVSVGDYVKQGEPLFSLINLSKVWVLFDAYEDDLSKISIGDKLVFSTPAFPGKLFKTHVGFIDPIINSKTRVASVRGELKNTYRQLKPEMLVNGTIQSVGARTIKISIPKTAVMWTGKRSVVYIKKADTEIPSFEYREIEIGESTGNSYEVLEGLSIGEEIVTNGSFSIDAAAQLNNQRSMMNKNVSLKKTDDLEVLPNYVDSTSSVFKDQLFELTRSYLTLKNNLVETNSASAKSAALTLLSSLEKVDMTLVKNESHLYWMKQQNAIRVHGEKISQSNSIEEQRKQFEFLSQAMISSVKAFGLGKETVYIQYCPMANNNAGADWISSSVEIRNPYFGNKMLKCGAVKDTINDTLFHTSY